MIELAADKGPRLELDEASLLDIGSCSVNGIDISPGERVPDDGDPRIFRAVQGFLFSCGPDHIRHPWPIGGDRNDQMYPLHGSASGHPARIIYSTKNLQGAECVAQADIETVTGGHAQLNRVWRIENTTGKVYLHDEIINTGSESWPIFWMYHMNVGGRFLGGETRLEGAMLQQGGAHWRFGPEPGGVFCVPAEAENDGQYEVRLGPLASPVGATLSVHVPAKTLPFLQIWRNQKTPVDVIGIEPVSHRWVDRGELEAAGEFDWLAPGESRQFGLSFAFS
ncbi:DUF4432 family protein [Oryzifoliimicrobium ureilyticus]|uniref:DUF4432 family protein n=1 Tax=Oryzifoliimicrobium ureilyticus TaxID=3113724 RepID=UPI0030763CFA